MAATKYQVLYRYMNESSNSVITNNMNNEYEEVCEFYSDEHKIYSSDSLYQMQAEEEKANLIVTGNSGENVKYDMLFAYNGTKKIKHKRWINDQPGKVVRDWTQIDRNLIGNRGDFSKKFTTLYAATPEDGGTVVCTMQVFNSYFKTFSITSSSKGDLPGTGYGKGYSSSHLMQLIIDSTFFKIKDGLNINSFLSSSNYSNLQSGAEYWKPGSGMVTPYTKYYTGPIFLDCTPVEVCFYSDYKGIGRYEEKGCYSSATLIASQIEDITIPGHYEEVTSYPYLVKDTYKRIEMSPWFVNATYGSLEAALERAKTLVDMIGMENVKIIKVVPVDQFVRIK